MRARRDTLVRYIACVSLAAVLAVIAAAEARRPGPAQVDAAVRLAQAEPAPCWEPDDQPADLMSPVLRAIMDCHEELGLSDAQVQRLDDLADTFFRETTGRRASLVSAQLALLTIMRPNPRDPAAPADAAAAEASIREIANLSAEQDIALLRAIEASKAVLTAVQRGRLAALMRDASPQPIPPQSL